MKMHSIHFTSLVEQIPVSIGRLRTAWKLTEDRKLMAAGTSEEAGKGQTALASTDCSSHCRPGELRDTKHFQRIPYFVFVNRNSKKLALSVL